MPYRYIQVHRADLRCFVARDGWDVHAASQSDTIHNCRYCGRHNNGTIRKASFMNGLINPISLDPFLKHTKSGWGFPLPLP